MQSTDQLEKASSEFGHNGQLTASGELDPKPKDASHSLDEPLAKLDCPTAEKDEPNKISVGGKKSTVEKNVREKIMCCECRMIVSKPNYARHVREYHPNLVRCLYNNCALYFDSVAERQQHLEQAHKNSRTFMKKRSCISVNKVAENCPLLAHKVASVVKCDVCKVTIRKDKLQSHLKMHQPKLKCAIRQCDSNFATKAEKRRHEEQVHAIKIPSLKKGLKRCMFCMKWYAHNRLNEHITRQHKDEAIKCDFGISCPKFFKTMSEKNEHFLKVHAAGRQELKCIYCSKMVFGKGQLLKHISRKHAEIRIRCKLVGCGQYFLSQVECDKHFYEEHVVKDGSLKWFQCSNCSFKSIRKWNLEKHFLRLHNIPPSGKRAMNM